MQERALRARVPPSPPHADLSPALLPSRFPRGPLLETHLPLLPAISLVSLLLQSLLSLLVTLLLARTRPNGSSQSSIFSSASLGTSSHRSPSPCHNLYKTSNDGSSSERLHTVSVQLAKCNLGRYISSHAMSPPSHRSPPPYRDLYKTSIDGASSERLHTVSVQLAKRDLRG